MKNTLLIISVIVLISVILFLHFANNKKELIPKEIKYSIDDSSSIKLSASIKTLDSLKPAVEQTIKKIKYYEGLKSNYQAKIVSIGYEKKTDNTEANELRRKLNEANREIDRLNGELASIKYKPVYKKQPEKYYTEQEIETPDENSLIVEINGKSKKGATLPTEGLTIYLIPFSKKAKKLMMYEASCDKSIIGNNIAKYYNGLYFFNDIKAGKYLIKICTYYGDYRLVIKESGKYKVEMQVAPPLQ